MSKLSQVVFLCIQVIMDEIIPIMVQIRNGLGRLILFKAISPRIGVPDASLLQSTILKGRGKDFNYP